MDTKHGKFVFSQGKTKIKLKENDLLQRFLYLPQATYLQLKLLELNNVKTPSNTVITLEIFRDNSPGPSSKRIFLSDYRTNFLYQKDTYILDLSKIEVFRILVNNDAFVITVDCPEPGFETVLYFETDQVRSVYSTEAFEIFNATS